MVTSPSGNGVVVIGGINYNEGKYSDALLELKDISKGWVQLKQKLQHARDDHVAIPIPDDWTIPNTTDAIDCFRESYICNLLGQYYDDPQTVWDCPCIIL